MKSDWLNLPLINTANLKRVAWQCLTCQWSGT